MIKTSFVGLTLISLLAVITYGPHVTSIPPVIKQTIQIPRQRGGPGIPSPFLATQKSYPAGQLYGDDKFGTVLTFDTSITGQLIKTEGYGSTKIGGPWNDNNTQGDTTFKSNLGISVHDISFNGNAQLHPYPYVTNGPDPDTYGPDYVPRADGLALQGGNFEVSRVKFYQIPGKALITTSLYTTSQSGPYGITDSGISRVEDVTIMLAHYGWVNDIGDMKAARLYITQVVKDGILNHGPGLKLNEVHLVGADRALATDSTVEGHCCYLEASRIGLELMPGSDGSSFHGIDMGPGTTWYRCIKINSNSNRLYDVHGFVRAEEGIHTDIAGVEFCAQTQNVLTGNISLANFDKDFNPITTSTSTAILIDGGSSSKIDVQGGWGGTLTGATYIKAAANFFGFEIIVRGAGDGGVAVVDLSSTTLNSVDGLGNHIHIFWTGTAPKVLYPGGGTTFNLHSGSTVDINGVNQ